MRMRSVLLVPAVMLAATLAPGDSRAGDTVRPSAGEALVVTDRRIEAAESSIASSPGPGAQTELAAARQGQAQARTAYASTRYDVALGATLAAREHANRAVAFARSLPDPGHVERQVEHTRVVIEHARGRIEACDNPPARRLLHVALAMQERAEHAVAESRYLASLQLTMNARDRVRKAMRMCNLGGSLPERAPRQSRGVHAPARRLPG